MTAQRITTQREHDEFSAGVRAREAFAAQRRDRRRPPPEQIEALLADPPQATPVYPEDGGKPIPPSVKAAATQAFLELIAASPSDTPKTLATEEGVREIESVWRTTGSVVERYYEQWPERRWYDLLFPAEPLLRQPADRAAEAFALATAPGVPAIVATCRVSEPWVMHSSADFDAAFEAIAGDLHCDLQISEPTVIDRKRYVNCLDWHRNWLEIVKRADGPDGQLQREFFEQNFVTLPVARGDLIILVRVCGWCYGAFLKNFAVDHQACVIEEPPYDDGFGLLPWKVIQPPATDESIDEPPDRFIYESDIGDDYDEDGDG
ncbi:hypothetical protein PJJ83_07960 [Mycobacterium kansasii]